jgi:hypothetical protein
LPNGANFAPDAVFGENKQLHVAQKSFPALAKMSREYARELSRS